MREGCDTKWFEGMGKMGESRGKGRSGGGDNRVASQGNISLHLVCHGKGATEEVAPQNWEGKDTRVPLPPATAAIWEAHSRRVPRVNSAEAGGGGGVADAPLEKQKEGERGHRD